MDNPNKKVAFVTLGCKLNFSETSAISRDFEEHGYKRVDASTKADVYVINTCSVTQLADKKSRQAIKKLINRSPDSVVIAVGCYAQLKPEALASIEGVDLVLGTTEKYRIFDFLNSFTKKASPLIQTCGLQTNGKYHSAYSMGDRTRSFLKVQDGCDYHCSYCTIPLARGKSRNQSIKEVLELANKIIRQGVKEIVLTGVNTGDFGKSTHENFFDLLSALDKIEEDVRFRISSIEPNLLKDEIISLINESKKFASHFHIPLQSGCDAILAAMQRRYKRQLFEDRVNKIKETCPEACIGADIIVGFPGETDQLFNETYQFLKKLDLSYLHVFPYSERPGTKAVLLPDKVQPSEKENRSKLLLSLSEEKRKSFYLQQIGKTEIILFETRSKEIMTGFSGNYIKTEMPYLPKKLNRLVECRFTRVKENGAMEGIELINDKTII